MLVCRGDIYADSLVSKDDRSPPGEKLFNKPEVIKLVVQFTMEGARDGREYA